MRFSIVMPVYEMGGNGHLVIEYGLKSLSEQTFKDFEVVVSDQSRDFLVADTCNKWRDKLNIVYCREEIKRGYFTANENWGIKHSAGEIIKFLDSDDMLYSSTTLEEIDRVFDISTYWLATDYVHSYDRVNFFNRHSPTLNPRIYVVNTIGTPSCVAIRNQNPVLFDENLRWAGDCEWYKQLYDKLGSPKIYNEITAIHLLWEGQVANTFGANSELQEKENAYIIAKYEQESQ